MTKKKMIVASTLFIFTFGLTFFRPIMPAAGAKENFPTFYSPEKIYPFMSTQEIPAAGEIIGSQEGAVNLIAGDVIYIQLVPSQKAKAGDHFFVGRYSEPVIHPQTKKIMGRIVFIPGEIVVLEGESNLITAKIHKSSQPIYGGDKIYSFPFLPPEETAPRTNQKITGQIMLSSDKSENITLKEYVFIDRGSQHGLITGTVFKIYRPARLGDKFLADKSNQMPKYKIGEAVVISVQKETSTALIINSSREIFPGDEVVAEWE